MPAGLTIVVMLYALAMWLVSMHNIYRSPPPAGYRNHLLSFVILTMAGISIETFSEIGLLHESLDVLGDALYLTEAAVFLYVAYNLNIQTREAF
ncbi:MAG: hypothetical protein MAG715_01228 [Methanonatronarchaeales archaeon]|nr:hypothetical protein [Methanonatronarchaeales archaeon]